MIELGEQTRLAGLMDEPLSDKAKAIRRSLLAIGESGMDDES